MHGRTKKSESALSLEEIEARRQKVKKGLKLLSHLLDQKNRGVYTPENFAATGKILDFAPEMGALWAYRREMLLHFLRQLRSEGEKDEEKEEEEKEGRSHANEEKTEEEEERNAEVHKEEEEEKDGEEKEQDGGHSVSKKRRKTNRIISSSSSSLSSSLPSSSSSRPSASSSVSCLTFLSHLHGGKDSQLDSCQKEGGADSSRDLHLLPPSPHLSFRDRAVFSLLYEELLSTRIAIAKKSSKNYCIWIHRTSCTGYLIHFLLSLSSTSPSLSSPSPASSLSSSPSPSPSSSASSLLSSSSFSLALSCILSLLREEMGSVESLLLSDSEDGRNFHAWHYSSQIASWRDAFLSLLSVVQKKSRKEEKENKEKKKKGANIDRRHLAKKGEAASQEKGEEDGEEEESEEEEKRRRDSEEEERMLQFTKRLIDKDFSNYTAWLYREQALFPSPCLAHRQVSTSSSSSLCRGCSFLRQSHKEAFEKELAWIWQGLYTEPNDQTLWRTYTSIILRFYHRQLKQRLLPSPHLVDLSSFSLPFNRKTHRHQPIDSSSLSSSPSSSSSSSLSSSCQSKDGGEESLVKETAHREETERDGVASEERKKGKEKRKMRIGWCFHFSSFCCIDTKESKCLLEVSRKDKERRERKKTTYSLAGDWKGLTSLSSRLSQGFNTSLRDEEEEEEEREKKKSSFLSSSSSILSPSWIFFVSSVSCLEDPATSPDTCLSSLQDKKKRKNPFSLSKEKESLSQSHPKKTPSSSPPLLSSSSSSTSSEWGSSQREEEEEREDEEEEEEEREDEEEEIKIAVELVFSQFCGDLETKEKTAEIYHLARLPHSTQALLSQTSSPSFPSSSSLSSIFSSFSSPLDSQNDICRSSVSLSSSSYVKEPRRRIRCSCSPISLPSSFFSSSCLSVVDKSDTSSPILSLPLLKTFSSSPSSSSPSHVSSSSSSSPRAREKEEEEGLFLDVNSFFFSSSCRWRILSQEQLPNESSPRPSPVYIHLKPDESDLNIHQEGKKNKEKEKEGDSSGRASFSSSSLGESGDACEDEKRPNEEKEKEEEEGGERVLSEKEEDPFIEEELEKIDELLSIEPSCKLAKQSKLVLLQELKPHSFDEQERLSRQLAIDDPQHRRFHEDSLHQILVKKRILSAVVARSSSSSSFLSLSLKNSLPPPLLLNGEKKEVEKSKKSIACLNRIEEEKDKEEREKETDGVQREKGERSFFVDLSSLHLRRLDFPLLIDASRIQEISLRSNSLTDRCWYNSHLPYLFSLRRLDLHGNLQLTLLLPLLLTLANLPYLQLVDLSSTGLRCTKEEEETDTFHLLEFLLLRESRKRTYKSKQEENEREEEEEGEREEKGHASLLLSSLVRSPKCIDISDTPLSRSFSLDGNRSPLSSTSSPEGEEGQRNAKEEEKEEKEAKKKEKRIWNCYAVVEKEVYIHPNDSEKKTEKVMSISAKEKEEWERSEKKEKREKESPKDKKKEEEEKEEEDEGKGSACIPNHNYTKEQKEKEEEKENSHLPSSLFPREEDQEKTMNEEKKHAEEIYHDDKEKKEERRRHVSTKLFLIEERK